MACVLEQLCLEVEAWDLVMPAHWPTQGGPGAHCALTNCDLEENCEPCELECMAADVHAIPAFLRDPQLALEAQEYAQDLRADEPLRLPSLRQVSVPGKCACRCCTHPLPFATDYDSCMEPACCALVMAPAARQFAVRREAAARGLRPPAAPVRSPSAPARRTKAAGRSQSGDDDDDGWWDDSWTTDDGSWYGGGYMPSWAQKT